jgi:hypothetical protein
MNTYATSYKFKFEGEAEVRFMRASIEAKTIKDAERIINQRVKKCKTVLIEIEYLVDLSTKVELKPLLAIYKGARDGDSYDNFTFDKVYEYVSPLDEAYVVARNDEGDLVEMPSIDFDFID